MSVCDVCTTGVASFQCESCRQIQCDFCHYETHLAPSHIGHHRIQLHRPPCPLRSFSPSDTSEPHIVLDQMKKYIHKSAHSILMRGLGASEPRLSSSSDDAEGFRWFREVMISLMHTTGFGEWLFTETACLKALVSPSPTVVLNKMESIHFVVLWLAYLVELNGVTLDIRPTDISFSRFSSLHPILCVFIVVCEVIQTTNTAQWKSSAHRVVSRGEANWTLFGLFTPMQRERLERSTAMLRSYEDKVYEALFTEEGQRRDSIERLWEEGILWIQRWQCDYYITSLERWEARCRGVVENKYAAATSDLFRNFVGVMYSVVQEWMIPSPTGAVCSSATLFRRPGGSNATREGTTENGEENEEEEEDEETEEEEEEDEEDQMSTASDLQDDQWSFNEQSTLRTRRHQVLLH
eukprot:PhF_6_TR37684/c0_g1_i1/m.56086